MMNICDEGLDSPQKISVRFSKMFGFLREKSWTDEERRVLMDGAGL